MRRRCFLLLPVFTSYIAWGQAPAAAPVPLVSPEILANRAVTFRLRAPNAKQVLLNLSGTERLPMQQGERGIWTVTTAPLAPDVYPYSFVIDGQSFADPSNPAVKTSIRGGPQTRSPASPVSPPGTGGHRRQ